jgi:hypothetical protein
MIDSVSTSASPVLTSGKNLWIVSGHSEVGPPVNSLTPVSEKSVDRFVVTPEHHLANRELGTIERLEPKGRCACISIQAEPST